MPLERAKLAELESRAAHPKPHLRTMRSMPEFRSSSAKASIPLGAEGIDHPDVRGVRPF